MNLNYGLNVIQNEYRIFIKKNYRKYITLIIVILSQYPKCLITHYFLSFFESVRTNQIPRQIPDQSVYTQAAPGMYDVY